MAVMAKDEGKPVEPAADGSTRSRKRRRKTTTAGAAEDCFACQKRQVTCDRRRPYCGQCINLGQACSGYRTVLTWGVGVASRGKLRGMTLPVTSSEMKKTTATKTAPATTATNSSKDKSPTGSTKPSASPKSQPQPSKKRRRSSSPAVKLESGQPLPQQDVTRPHANFYYTSHQSYHHPAPPVSYQQYDYQHQSNGAETWRGPEYRYASNGVGSDHHIYPSPVTRPSSDSARLPSKDSTSGSNIPLKCDASIAGHSDSTLDASSDLPATPERVIFADPFPYFPYQYHHHQQQQQQRQQQQQQQQQQQIQQHHQHHQHHHQQQQQQQQQHRLLPPTPISPHHHAPPPQDQVQAYAQQYPRQNSTFYAPPTTQAPIMPAADMVTYHHQGINQPPPQPIYYTSSPSQAHIDAAMPMAGLHKVYEPAINFSRSSYDSAEEQDIFEGIDEENYVTSDTLMPRFDPGYLNSPYPHVPPRMQQLLDYYNRFICSVLVTVDGDDNPYRKHVLNLAVYNEGLQNAIGALVTNNMRMRTLANMPGLKEEAELSIPTDGAKKISSIHAPTPEEQWYKAKSIEHLNLQLSSQGRARDDSVLATLLILCLFHVCDSGFSKFKTQLAGVQKLLKMRGKDVRTEFVGWVEMFFAWFDVMSSSVNDREVEIQGESLDFLDLSANFGALEQFSGCDGRLFKLIARLGRLNLLSQNRPVKDLTRENKRPTNERKGSDRSTSHAPTSDYYSLSNESIESDEWRPLNARPNIEKGDFPDDRHTFWREWRDIRRRLEEWSIDQPYDDNGPKTPAGPEKELLHISESFRYSALIYTERLAFPQLPSASPNFQQLVNQAIYHIEEIDGDSCVIKFMLWPLFITGTECVNESHRELIRTRCLQIQLESGFYNNLSGLQVLERVWHEPDEARAAFGNAAPWGQQAFHWRNAMDRVDGEYIVI